jgi:uncharacterized repeat protein (TIGR03803 family)
VTVGSTGTLYGSLFKLFGSLNIGTAFSLTPPASPGDPWTESDVSSDAIGSVALVVQVSSGTLFGTSEVGGSSGDGEIFAAVPPKEPGGAWSVTAVHSFAGGSDGNMPTAGLTLHAKGVLYGTTYSGGGSANCDNGCGTIFSLTPTAGAEGVGRAFTEAVLYAFSNGADGANPYAGVTEGTGGVLYTVTQQGGNTSCAGGCGTIASLTPPATLGDPWTPALVHSFTGDDGQYPTGTLVRDYTVFYGTTTRGGADGCGTVFELRL